MEKNIEFEKLEHMTDVGHRAEGSNTTFNNDVPQLKIVGSSCEEEADYDVITTTALTDLPAPPDGGWGWVIVFASFMCNFVLDGIAYSFGVVILPIIDHFDCSPSTASWVGSLLCGVYMLSGPVVSGLVMRFGCRPVSIFGAVLASTAFVVSTFSPSIHFLMLTYGILGGFGIGLIYLPAVIMCGYYFEKKRALATGISVCGSGVGCFAFAPFATMLVRNFGWRGVLLVYAGLILNCCIFGALMRPLQLVIVNNEVEDEEGSCALETVVEPQSSDSHELRTVMPDGTVRTRHVSQLSGSSAHFLSPERKVSPGQHKSFNLLSDSSCVIAEDVEDSDDTSREEKGAEEESLLNGETVTGKHISTLTDDGKSVDDKLMRRRTVCDSNHLPISIFSRSHHFMSRLIPSISTHAMPRNVSNSSFEKNHKTVSKQRSRASFSFSRTNEQRRSLSKFNNICDGRDRHLSSRVHLVPITITQKDGHNSSTFSVVNPLSRKDVFYTGSILQLAQEQHADNSPLTSVRKETNSIADSITNISTGLNSQVRDDILKQYRHSIISTNHYVQINNSKMMTNGNMIENSITDLEVASKNGGGLDVEMKQHKLFSMKLLLDPIFLLIALSNVFGFLALYVPYIYLPKMVVSHGDLTIENASLIISVIGISNTLGRIFIGWLVDFPQVNALFVTNISLFASGVCLFIMPYCHTLDAYLSIAVILGFSLSAFISLTSIVLVDLIGLDNLTSAFGLLVSFRGMASIVGPPLAGIVFEYFQTYSVSLYMAAIFFTIASTLGFLSQMKDKLMRQITFFG